MSERIAVVGAGLMGHGIAQVFAVAGHDVTVTDAVTGDPRHRRRARCREPRARRSRSVARRRPDHHRREPRRGARRRGLRCRGGPRGPRPEARPVRAHEQSSRAGDDPRHEHLGDVGRRDRRARPRSRPRRRHALLEPAAPDPARRGDPGRADAPRDRERDDGAPGARRQGPDPRQARHPGLRREPPPARALARGDLPRRARRLRRGGGRRASSRRASGFASRFSARSRTQTWSGST